MSFSAPVQPFSWTFGSTPRQCQNLLINTDGLGTPPYNVLVVPSDSKPNLPISINSSDSSISLVLTYPQGSQFVAVVSDSMEFGNGGTSTTASVLSGDTSCDNPEKESFDFSTDRNEPTSCASQRLYWTPAQVNGTVQFQCVIPRGQSQGILQGPLTEVQDEGTGFEWTPNIQPGTDIIVVAGDDRGLGSGGSIPYVVQRGSTTSCLNETSPSTTPGSPAGGAIPTGTQTIVGPAESSSSRPSSLGAIIGGAIGGVVALFVLGIALFCVCRHRLARRRHVRPLDLLPDDDWDERSNSQDANPTMVAHNWDPFVLPPSARSPSQGHAETVAATQGPLPDVREEPAMCQGPRKTAVPSRLMRPGRILQHTDGGVANLVPEEPELEPVVELPPAYASIGLQRPSM